MKKINLLLIFILMFCFSAYADEFGSDVIPKIEERVKSIQLIQQEIIKKQAEIQEELASLRILINRFR